MWRQLDIWNWQTWKLFQQFFCVRRLSWNVNNDNVQTHNNSQWIYMHSDICTKPTKRTNELALMSFLHALNARMHSGNVNKLNVSLHANHAGPRGNTMRAYNESPRWTFQAGSSKPLLKRKTSNVSIEFFLKQTRISSFPLTCSCECVIAIAGEESLVWYHLNSRNRIHSIEWMLLQQQHRGNTTIHALDCSGRILMLEEQFRSSRTSRLSVW